MKLNINNQKFLIAAVFLISSPAFAVDLVGIHDLAIKNDPQLQAAAYRKDATGENTRQAWANLLPTISGRASRDWGDATTRVGEVIIDGETVQPRQNKKVILILNTMVLICANPFMHKAITRTWILPAGRSARRKRPTILPTRISW